MLSKILRLFVNTLTADDKYSLLNRDNLTQQIKILAPQKENFSIFSAFLKFTLNSEHFQKKMTFIVDVFPKLQTRKKWLDKFLKTPVSYQILTRNMVNGSQHSSILDYNTFTIFSEHCGRN